MTEIRYPVPVQLGAFEPPAQRILGMPADAFIRVAMPLTTGALSAVALVYSIRGNQQAATALALVGVISSSLMTAVRVYDMEERASRPVSIV